MAILFFIKISWLKIPKKLYINLRNTHAHTLTQNIQTHTKIIKTTHKYFLFCEGTVLEMNKYYKNVFLRQLFSVKQYFVKI